MFTPVELIALILVVFLVIKILLYFTSPRGLLNIEKGFLSHPSILRWISLILAGIVLNYILKEVSITQIFAVLAFLSLLFVIGASFFGREIINMKESVIRSEDGVRKLKWYAFLWIILLVWVLEEILTK